MTGPAAEPDAGHARKAITDSTQDWLAVPDADGRLVAHAEAEWTWRDEDYGVRLYVLLDAKGRGSKIDLLNRNGLVLVDIREHWLRLAVTDVVHKVTLEFQWLNFWGPIVPEKSEYHLSSDKKRMVLWLHKVSSVHAHAAPWGHLLDIRRGRYSKSSTGWPAVLCEVQGAWRSEDEEPIEIVGHQVIWPEGSRDTLLVDEETEAFRLIQAGDGNKVSREEFDGIYERHSVRFKWQDGDLWTRIPGMAAKRQDAGRGLLPLAYSSTLARWVPWLPPDEVRKQMTLWLPPNEAEVALEVTLADGPGLDLKRELLASVEGNATMADFDYLPQQLLVQCRICALAEEELCGAGFVDTVMALRDNRRVSRACEAAALGGLQRWLQWLRVWLAPGSRRNVDGALKAIKERLFEAVKDERHWSGLHQAPNKESVEQCYSRWPPVWSCMVERPNDLLREATAELLQELERARSQRELQPQLAFGTARRLLGERLLDRHSLPAGTRRCDPAEKRWVRRYAHEASKYLLDLRGSGANLGRDLREGGIAVVEDVLDWGSLVKAQGEMERLFRGEESWQFQHFSMRSGHTQWATVWGAKLEELGMPALAAAAAFLQQLPARLNEWNFARRNWSAGDPVLWWDDGSRLDPGRRPEALACGEPPAPGGEEEPWACGDARTVEDPDAPTSGGGRVLALLFLNTPAWVPAWGGALRCRLPSVDRDVWGDGGRLVLLQDDLAGYELLPSSHARAVMLIHLDGASTRPRPRHAEREEPQAEPVPAEQPLPQGRSDAEATPEEPGTAPESAADAEMAAAPAAEPTAEQQPLEMDSRQVIEMCEASLPAVFQLD